MKMKLLVTDVTAIGTPSRAECAVLGVILAWRVFGQSRSYLWSGSHFVVKNPLLSEPLAERNVLFWGAFWLGVFLANSGHICGR